MGDFLAHILNLAPKVQLRRQLFVRILRRLIVRNLKFRAGDVVLFDSRLLHSSIPTSEATKVKFQSSVREDEILLADQDKKLAIYVQYGNSLAFRSYLRYRLQDSNYPGVDNAELFQHHIRPFIGVDDGAYFDYLSMAHETKEWKRGNSS